MAPAPRFRALFLCTGNSARSQMAEAVLNWKGKGLFHNAFLLMSWRIDLLLALPFDKLQRLALEAQVRAIGGEPPGGPSR